MPKKYVVELTAAERERLRSTVRTGRESARALTRARVLLKADEGHTDDEIADAVDTSRGTAERVRKRFCTGGTDAVLSDRPQPARPQKRRSTGRPRPGWSRWPVRRRRTGGSVGRWTCWPTAWSACGTWTARSAGRRSAGC